MLRQVATLNMLRKAGTSEPSVPLLAAASAGVASAAPSVAFRAGFASSSSASVSSSTRAPAPLPRPRRAKTPSSLSAEKRSYATSSSPAPKAASTDLTWDQYLRLRRSRRLAGLVTTIPTTVLSLLGSGSYFLTLELDPANTIGGIDPAYICALATLACTGLGWLVGPTVGTAAWTLLHGKESRGMARKDKDFFHHVKARRVDPSRQSVQNPVPDFYGEKIGSMKQYRQWLRDQAAYRRKAAHGLKQDAAAE